MGSKLPIFPILEAQHYNDYGFDPELDYIQILEEARRHGKRSEASRPLDVLHCKLQRPISKDDYRAKSKKRRWWWKSAALLFWKRNKTSGDRTPSAARSYRAVSGPLYMIDDAGSGLATTCWTSRPGSGPLQFTEAGEAGVPFVSLRDLNLLEEHRISASNPAPMPIYLVT